MLGFFLLYDWNHRLLTCVVRIKIKNKYNKYTVWWRKNCNIPVFCFCLGQWF